VTDTLRALGERVIVSSILPRFSKSSGDDCAYLPVGAESIVVTTDPVPIPAASFFGGDPDLYWAGWLLVTINASDIAASGASPLGFLAAIEAPPSLDLVSFERLLEGVRDACALYKLEYVGGNLKESEKFHAVGIALGRVRGKGLRRDGARPGDILVSVGAGGIFWRDVLRLRAGQALVQRDLSPVFRPVAQLDAMAIASEFLSASIDNSDGLLPSLVQLAQASSVSIVLDLDRLTVDGVDGDVDPARLWLGWGDWNVVATVSAHSEPTLRARLSAAGHIVTSIGVVTDGSGVVVKRGAAEAVAPRLESERFAADSWFATGPEEYLRRMLSISLP
jgi:thiamine-monophosphate kinase